MDADGQQDLLLTPTVRVTDALCAHYVSRKRQDHIRPVQKGGPVLGAPTERKSPSAPLRLFRRSQVSGQPRDLRKIDSRIPNLVPTILVRKEAILVRSRLPAPLVRP